MECKEVALKLAEDIIEKKKATIKNNDSEKKQTTLRLSEEEMEKYTEESYKLGYSLNTYLVMLIRQGRETVH